MNEFSFPVTDVASFKAKALQWASQFAVAMVMESNAYAGDRYSRIDWMMAVDAIDSCDDLSELDSFVASKKNKLFGHFGYNLKNTIYTQLASIYTDSIDFGDCFWFEPRYILQLSGNRLTINRNFSEAGFIFDRIGKEEIKTELPLAFALQPTASRADYLQNVTQIIGQIAAGDFYELNYCCDFSAIQQIHPASVFQKLNELAVAPFSVFYKKNNSHLLCASPERFLQKNGNTLLAQPIKGTIRKGNDDAENQRLLTALENDLKERAENNMIVDLTRNDLAKNAVVGSVSVKELCKAYSFKNINQLISTVSCEVRTDVALSELIKATFPMGSMTGAPKLEVMKNIDRYENFNRGIYSGSVGYIDAITGDFDWNVVIRAVLYHSATSQLAVRAGSAITYHSQPEKEYTELLLKARSLCEALNAEISSI